jgi:hypothetical protein
MWQDLVECQVFAYMECAIILGVQPTKVIAMNII